MTRADDAQHPSLGDIAAYLSSTDEASWWAGPTFRSPDGTQHCALAHIEARWGVATMEWFEERWSTSYVIGAVNDGTHPGYPQATPKARCLWFLADLAAGRQRATTDPLEAEMAFVDEHGSPFVSTQAACEQFAQWFEKPLPVHDTVDRWARPVGWSQAFHILDVVRLDEEHVRVLWYVDSAREHPFGEAATVFRADEWLLVDAAGPR